MLKKDRRFCTVLNICASVKSAGSKLQPLKNCSAMSDRKIIVLRVQPMTNGLGVRRHTAKSGLKGDDCAIPILGNDQVSALLASAGNLALS